jgi:transcription initiation factor TFIID subunit 7
MAAMDDDLIVVDDFEHTQPINHRSSVIQNASQEGTSSITSRLRTRNSCFSTTSTSYAPAMESTERTTRSSASKPKLQPKLKLKLSEKAAAQAPGMSFLGAYDRELDSDDEDLSFEEQFILRLPPGEDLEKLRKMVASREMTNDVWFKFKGA